MFASPFSRIKCLVTQLHNLSDPQHWINCALGIICGSRRSQGYTSKKDPNILWPFPQRLIIFKGFEQQDHNSQVSFVVIQVSKQINQDQFEDCICPFPMCPHPGKLCVKAVIIRFTTLLLTPYLTLYQLIFMLSRLLELVIACLGFVVFWDISSYLRIIPF